MGVLGKLTEWIKLIPEGVKNADKIVDGIINDLALENNSLPEDEREEIIRRRVICAGCPYMSDNAKAAGTYTSEREDHHCTFCKCPISTRTASLTSQCGISKHNRKYPNNQLPLKWDVYIK